jgi:hypothetical protein
VKQRAHARTPAGGDLQRMAVVLDHVRVVCIRVCGLWVVTSTRKTKPLQEAVWVLIPILKGEMQP